MSSVIILDQVDDKNFNLLFGLSSLGVSIGMILLPMLAGLMSSAYGWRGSMLVLGGLMTNCIPSAMAVKSKQREQVTMKEGPPSEELVQTGTESYQSGRVQDDDEFKNSPDRTPLLPRKEDAPFLMKLSEMIRNSDFYRDPWINFILLSNFFDSIVYIGWHAFLVPHAISMGVSLQNVIIITLFAALGNMTGRFLSGVLTHRLLSPTSMFLILCPFNIAALLGYAFTVNIFIMVMTSFVSALVVGARAVLVELAGRERASPDDFPAMFSASTTFFGIGNIVGGYLSGNSFVW